MEDDADDLPNHEGVKSADNRPSALYTAAFRAGRDSPRHEDLRPIQVAPESCVVRANKVANIATANNDPRPVHPPIGARLRVLLARLSPHRCPRIHAALAHGRIRTPVRK